MSSLVSPPGCDAVELLSGVDALYLSGRGDLPAPLLEYLDALRNQAAEGGSPVDASLGGYSVRVLGHGWGKYAYCCVHDLARIGFTRSESLPAVRVQPTSVGLHALGPALLVLWVRNFLDASGIDATVTVSRLDLHSDWQGIWIDAEERTSFVSYSNQRALYEVDEDLSGLNFGRRGAALYARCYDKTRESEKEGTDYWPELWGDKFDPEERVLRVEFEFTRDGLREFGINTPEDAFDNIGPLWAYATGKWLSLRVPTDDVTRSRWPVDARWAAIQRSTLAGSSLPAERIRAGQQAGDIRRMLPQLYGWLTGAAATLGTNDLVSTFAALSPHIAQFEAQTGKVFAQEAIEKRRRR